ncbi:hypothetical protein RRG08_059030, partial [Elysia crispata]
RECVQPETSKRPSVIGLTVRVIGQRESPILPHGLGPVTGEPLGSSPRVAIRQHTARTVNRIVWTLVFYFVHGTVLGHFQKTLEENRGQESDQK